MQLFNRNDPSVISDAKSLTEGEFIKKYKSKTTEAVLTRVYREFLKARGGQQREENLKVLKDTAEKQSPVVQSGEPLEVAQPDVKTIKKAVVPPAKVTPASTKAVPTKKGAAKATSTTAPASKQEVLVPYLTANPNATFKEIETFMKDKGFKIYSSEVANAKRKIR